MFEFFGRLFDVTDFTPRAHCGVWSGELIWLHRGSDLFIWLAYVSIPLILLFFCWRRRALPFRGIFLLFAAFILLCGCTHLLDALMFEYPVYRLSGVVKFLTAAVSVATVLALVPTVPAALAFAERMQATPATEAAPAPRSRAWAYAVAAVLGVAAVLVRAALHPLLGDRPILIVPFLAVMLVSWASGFWPSLVTLGLSMLGVIFFFVPPERSLGVRELPDQIDVVLFFFGGVGCALLGESQRLARRKAEAALEDSLRRQDELRQEIGRRAEVERSLRQREEELTERARLSAFTGKMGTIAVSTKDLAGTLKECCEAVVADLGAAFARVWELPPGGDVLELRASAGQYTHLDGPHSRVPVGQFEIGRIAASLKPHLHDDVANDPEVGDREWAAREGMRSFAGYPLVVQGRPVGVVALFSRRPLSQATLAALGTAADAIALRMQREGIEQDLRESRDLMQSLADSIPPLAWMTRPDGRRFWFNRRWYEYTGTTPEQVEGWGWQCAHDPSELPRVLDKFHAHLASGEPWEDLYPLRRHDGAMRWFLSRARPIRDAEGCIVRWVGTNIDVEDQRRLQEDLRQSAARFSNLVEALPKLVWTADASGRVDYVNRRWVEYTGLKLEASADAWLAVTHPDDAPAVAAKLASAFRTGEPVNLECRLRRAGGEFRWHLCYAVPTRDSAGEVVQWVGAATDVDVQKRTAEYLERLVRERTASLSDEVEVRKQAEKVAEAALAELRRSNGELEQFAYVASHDLQEPLRKIQAFGTRLEAKFRDQLGEQGRDYVDRMQNSAARMQRLIEDLLTFSRVSTRGQDFREVDLSQVAREVVSDLEARILQTGGIVRLGDLPTLRADHTQMRQLLQNLLGNALKFARPGVPPVVSVSAEAVEDGWRLTVRDNGIGFDERYLDRIFQVFQRLHGRGTYEGTGVGLAICKKIAERHGGTITASSRPGEGAAFVVTLPRTPPTEARA